MPKYSVTINYQRTEIVEVDADNKAAAVALVNEGDYNPEDIFLAPYNKDDFFKIISAKLIK